MTHRPAEGPPRTRRRARSRPPLLAALLAATLALDATHRSALGATRDASPGTAADPTAELLAALNEERARYAMSPFEASLPLVAVAGERAAGAAAAGDLETTSETATEITRRMRRAGYAPHAWRQRLVQGPRDAAALLRHWRESDRDGYEEIVLGDLQGFGAGVAAHPDGPIWSLLFALPRIAWERRQAAPLADVETVRDGVLAAVNAERRAAGLPPVRVEPRLHVVATGHANDMARRGFFDHVTPEGTTPVDRVRQGGYPPQRVAENLAKGLFEPAEVVRRWMLSPGHRRNILDPRVREVGIAVVAREEGHEVLPLWVLVLAGPA